MDRVSYGDLDQCIDSYISWQISLYINKCSTKHWSILTCSSINWLRFGWISTNSPLNVIYWLTVSQVLLDTWLRIDRHLFVHFDVSTDIHQQRPPIRYMILDINACLKHYKENLEDPQAYRNWWNVKVGIILGITWKTWY